jgi:hypothetical protein
MSKSPSRLVALVMGAAFVLLGALSFIATAGMRFTDPNGIWLLDTLAVNPAQNTLHLVVGAALIGIAFTRVAPVADSLVGALLVGVGIHGLFTAATPLNIFAANGAANLLHFAAAAVLLAVGLGARR